jgi:HSP20 family molecular chaperone IbpA
VSCRTDESGLFDDAGRGWKTDEPSATTTWSPSVDIYETDTEIVVKAELPESSVRTFL